MVTVDLINELIVPNNTIKGQIDQLLKKGYIEIQNLRKMSMDKTLTLEYILEVEQLFIQNQFSTTDLNLPKYLKKYAQCLSAYWDSYSYYNKTQRSRGKFHLFDSLRQNDLVKNIHYSESEMALIQKKLENYWIASNQIYTKYEISLIKKEYIR